MFGATATAYSARENMRDILQDCLDRVQSEMGRPTEIMGIKLRIDPTLKPNHFRYEPPNLRREDDARTQQIAALVQSILQNGIKMKPKD
jgi:hypothetical protein